MTFPVVLLWITSAMFTAFGVGFAAVPEQLADFILDASPSTSSAMIDMRATYGGVAIGLGVFMGLCASRPQWIRQGLMATLLVLTGLAVTRLVGLVADGDPNGFMLLNLALELGGAGLTAVAIRRIETAAT